MTPPSPKMVRRSVTIFALVLFSGLMSSPVWGSPPLQGPKTSATKESAYLLDVAKADPGLSTYVQSQGNVALRALLTDGSAFCAFLKRGGGIDAALASVAIGAKSVESQTHLPLKIRTFNTMEAVALLTLCPSEQGKIPAEDRAKVLKLGHALRTQAG